MDPVIDDVGRDKTKIPKVKTVEAGYPEHENKFSFVKDF